MGGAMYHVEDEICEAIAHSGCLQTLSVAHGIHEDEDNLDLGKNIQDALLRNRCAAGIATQLGQVCRLDEFPGSREKFKDPSFRLCLLSFWLAPQALPQHLK